jgi:hypothetical protein
VNSDRIVKQGAGWRVGWDPAATEFKALVGADDWALELTETEWQEFCQLTNQLAATMQTMQQELMDQEAIACEAESSYLWLEAEGLPTAYTLHLILQTGRRGEGRWSTVAVPGLLHAIQAMKLF